MVAVQFLTTLAVSGLLVWLIWRGLFRGEYLRNRAKPDLSGFRPGRSPGPEQSDTPDRTPG